MEEQIKEYAKEIGIVAIGITGPGRFDDALPIYRKRILRGYLTGGRVPKPGFEEPDLELRVNPALSLSGVNSIVSVAVPYNTDYSQSRKPEYHGQIAKVAWGRDYHVVVSDKMNRIVQFLKDFYPDIRYKMMVDSGPLIDRVVALRAGLGWIGKNNTLIVPGVGSWVFLGEILIDKKLQADSPITMDCGRCEECIKACPTRALVEPHVLNARLCLSYVTQNQDVPSSWILTRLGRRLYGCDICQEACPHNRTAPRIGDKAFTPDVVSPFPDLIRTIEMDAKSHAETFGQTSAGWIGHTLIQRNAILALADYKDTRNLPLVKKLQHDSRPLIREISAKAERIIFET